MSGNNQHKRQYIIPTQPESFLEFSRQMNSQEPDISGLVNCLKQDPALYTAVLATANSAHFSRNTPTTSLNRAVMRLGLKRLACIVRLVSIKNSLSKVGRLDRFWDTASEVGDLMAYLISKHTRLNPDDAYSIGMLHDSGIPLMISIFPDYRNFLQSNSKENVDELYLNEKSQYGFDHHELGAEIALKWGMPKVVTNTILAQSNIDCFLASDDPELEDSRTYLCYLVVAKDISKMYRAFWRVGNDKAPSKFMQAILSYLGLPDWDYFDLRDDLLEELESIQ